MVDLHTPGPWFAGAQNDALFIVAGRPPALNNDHPWHEAPRVALCRVFGPSKDDCLPINADANARRIVACVNACEGISTEALEGGELTCLRAENETLREALKEVLPYTEAERLAEAAKIRANLTDRDPVNKAIKKARAAISLATGEAHRG